MASEITMPQLSDTMTEGTVVKWHKKEGDAVKAGEEIADVETDKATMPMEAFDSGTLALIATQEGQKAKVGQLMAVIALPGENVEEIKKQAQAGEAGRQTAVGTPQPVAQTHGTTPRDVETDHPKLEEERATSRQEVTTPAAGTAAELSRISMPHPGEEPRGENGQPMRVSPLARRIAADRGVDLSHIHGSGPGGRIIERDVLGYLEGSAAKAPAAAPPAPSAPAAAPAAAKPAAPAKPLTPVLLTGQKEVVPMTKMRTAIAAALQRSKQVVPHFYETADIDLEAVVQLRQRLNQVLEKENIRLSINDFVIKAVAVALMRHPALNARLNAEKNEITRYGDVNMGLAVAIPDGLIVPVLRGVNQMGLRDIRVRSLDLFDRARAQRLRREEQTEATFTISSLGSQGIRQFVAIINPPEVGILAVGSAEKRPVVKGDQIVARTMLTVTLSADHRVVDGAVAADFLMTLRNILEEPGMMLV